MYVECLRGTRGLGVAFVLKPCLFILPDLTDDLLIEVLHEVEPVVDDIQARVPLKECPLEVGVHVAGDGLHMQTSTQRARSRTSRIRLASSWSVQATAHAPS
jgi:hypothetical protein